MEAVAVTKSKLTAVLPPPYEPRQVTYEFVTSLPFYDGAVTSRVLEALCNVPELVPEKYGTEERGQSAFDPHAWPKTPGVPNAACTYHFKRTKRLKYIMRLHPDWRPRLYLDFDPKMPAKDYPLVFEASDAVAAACEPDIGWVHFSSHVNLPSATPGDEIQEVMDLATDAHAGRWRDQGPRGLGMRTYIGPLFLEQLGRERVLSLPVPVTALSWGGVRVDLTERPWACTREELHDAWLRAMEHLRPAGIFATYQVSPTGAVKFTPGVNLKNYGGKVKP
jgi:hypothetical protein